MNPIQTLELALNKEKQSIELYQKLAIKHPVIKELLTFLANEEEKHKKKIEEKISEIK